MFLLQNSAEALAVVRLRSCTAILRTHPYETYPINPTVCRRIHLLDARDSERDGVLGAQRTRTSEFR